MPAVADSESAGVGWPGRVTSTRSRWERPLVAVISAKLAEDQTRATAFTLLVAAAAAADSNDEDEEEEELG